MYHQVFLEGPRYFGTPGSGGVGMNAHNAPKTRPHRCALHDPTTVVQIASDQRYTFYARALSALQHFVEV
jgi:hypothetical protein